jgi:hypothetical protein
VLTRIYGPGYTADIFTYSHESVVESKGELVDTDYVGRFTLDEGSLMLYEASRHIHTQYPPDDFSISINLLPKQKCISPQYAFKIQDAKVYFDHIVSQGSPMSVIEKYVNHLNDAALSSLFKEFKAERVMAQEGKC